MLYKETTMLILVFASFCAAALPAMAYVGPGPGLTMIGSLIGLVGSILLALLMVLAWPLRLYLKKQKAKKAGTPPSDPHTPAE
jgi:membrane associated rhomboid family serine protease